MVAFIVDLKRMSNDNTGTTEGDDDNNNVDNGTDQPEDDGDPNIPVYREARDFILVAVDKGRLGHFQGTVINLTLIPGMIIVIRIIRIAQDRNTWAEFVRGANVLWDMV